MSKGRKFNRRGLLFFLTKITGAVAATPLLAADDLPQSDAARRSTASGRQNGASEPIERGMSPDLADTGHNKGAALIGYALPERGVPQTVASKLSQIVNVRDFGAVGDGVADDTAALQKTIDHVEAAGGGFFAIPAGRYRITSTLAIPGDVGINGEGRDCTIIRTSEPIQMIAWANGRQRSGSSIQNLTIDGSQVAVGGMLIGAGGDYRMTQVEIRRIAGRGLVLHTTQNSSFEQLQVSYSDTLLYLTNGAWNNVFVRCEFNAPSKGGFGILSQNDRSYVARIGGKPLTDNRHNGFIGCVIERGQPRNIIRLEDDGGDNYFLGCEIQGGSRDNPQIFINGPSNYFGGNTTIQEGGSGAAWAIENRGYGTVLNGVTMIGWSKRDWAHSTELLLAYDVRAAKTNGIVGSPGKKFIAHYFSSFRGATYWVVNNVIKVTQRAYNGRPTVSFAGDAAPEQTAAFDLGDATLQWRSIHGESVNVNGTPILSGKGSPQGVVKAPVGTLYLRSDGGAGTTLYVKEAGTGSDGWTGK